MLWVFSCCIIQLIRICADKICAQRSLGLLALYIVYKLYIMKMSVWIWKSQMVVASRNATIIIHIDAFAICWFFIQLKATETERRKLKRYSGWQQLMLLQQNLQQHLFQQQHNSNNKQTRKRNIFHFPCESKAFNSHVNFCWKIKKCSTVFCHLSGATQSYKMFK